MSEPNLSDGDQKPLKRFRSHAERVAMWQRNVQIALSVLIVGFDVLLVLRAFHFI